LVGDEYDRYVPFFCGRSAHPSRKVYTFFQKGFLVDFFLADEERSEGHKTAGRGLEANTGRGTTFAVD